MLAGSRGFVPDAVAPPPRHPRYPLLDGMRAVAVLAVVLVHAAGTGAAFSPSLPGRMLAHLNVGVTIFFLISGFLLYRPMIAHRTAALASPKLGDYIRRRVLRIYPAYWLVLTVLFVVPGASGVVGGNWWPMYALVHTLPIYPGPQCWTSTQCGLAQTWSLVVELTFYVALPVYAAAMATSTRRLDLRAWMVTEFAVLGLLAAASVLVQFGALWPTPTWLSGSLIGYLLWFTLGMAMAVWSVARTGLAPNATGAGHPGVAARGLLRFGPELCWGLALALYVGLSLWLPPTPFLLARGQQLAVHVGFAVIAALCLFPAIFMERSPGLPGRLLATRTMIWLGLISYGIFLWHYVVTLKLGYPGAGASFPVVLVGTLAISIPCAAVSYYLLERPVLRLKYRRLRELRRRRASPTGVPVSGPGD